MILALDTSTPTCRAWLVHGNERQSYEWEANRELADDLLKYLRDTLAGQQASWSDLTGLVVYQGPGSFTGLRIGLSVANTMADTLGIPIIGGTGDDWLDAGVTRIGAGESDHMVLPIYGREPNITTRRK